MIRSENRTESSCYPARKCHSSTFYRKLFYSVCIAFALSPSMLLAQDLFPADSSVTPQSITLKKIQTQISKASSSTERLTSFIRKRTKHMLDNALESEVRITQALISNGLVPPSAMKEVNSFYSKMNNDLSGTIPIPNLQQNYLPGFDSLLTASRFLTSMFDEKAIRSFSNQIEGSQNLFNQAANVQKLVSERLDVFVSKFYSRINVSQIKKLKNINASFKAQVAQFRQMINDPSPHLEKVLSMALSQNNFKAYFNENSTLFSLFRNPALGIKSQTNDASLPTIKQLEAQIHEKFGRSGTDLLQRSQKTSQESISSVQNDLMLSLIRDQNSSSEGNVNGESIKPLKERFSVSTDIKSQRSTGIVPTFSEVGLNFGYKLKSGFVAGLGISGRISWGNNLSEMKVKASGLGLRSFADYKIKGGIFATAAFEAVYMPLGGQQGRLSQPQNWQKNGLIGLKKGFKIKNGFIKGSSVKLMWNYLSYKQKGFVQPFDFRIGYNF